MTTEAFDLAAKVAEKLANARMRAGTDTYAPDWYRHRGPKPLLHFGDCGAIEAIRSGDPDKMRVALAALEDAA